MCLIAKYLMIVSKFQIKSIIIYEVIKKSLIPLAYFLLFIYFVDSTKI